MTRFARLEDWLGWIERQHPRQIELGLERVGAVWQRLQPGRLQAPLITVAGTNGKGSCVAMLEAILGAAGYRTGCYTSPYLIRYNERIRIAGEPVTDGRICAALERIDQARGDIPLTYFEFGTLAALDIFATETLDAVILEVGLGGRLDAVNILPADVALVTTIDLDHQHWLGEDREAIGREKAGIFRAGRPAVCGDPHPPRSLLSRARELGSPLWLLQRDFGYRRTASGWDWIGPGRRRTALPLPALRGEVQLQNAASVLMVLECLDARLPVDQGAVRRGLRSVSLAGRFQLFGGEADLILDVAHNPQAARVLAANLDALPPAACTRAVFSIMGDKDIDSVVRIMGPLIQIWYLADMPGERGIPAQEIGQALRAAGITTPVSCHATVGQAVEAARRVGGPADRLLIFGSFVTVGEALSLLQQERAVS